MAYATTKPRSRGRKVRVEKQRTAHWYIFRFLRWMGGKDLAYLLYRRPAVSAYVFVNGKLAGVERIRRNEITGINIVVREGSRTETPVINAPHSGPHAARRTGSRHNRTQR